MTTREDGRADDELREVYGEAVNNNRLLTQDTVPTGSGSLAELEQLVKAQAGNAEKPVDPLASTEPEKKDPPEKHTAASRASRAKKAADAPAPAAETLPASEPATLSADDMFKTE